MSKRWLRLDLVAFLSVVVIGALAIGVIGWEIREQNADIEAQVKQNREAIRAANLAVTQARALTKVVESERKQREREIASAVAQECRENEAQDAALVLVLKGAIQERLRQPRTPERAEFISVLRDAIADREPRMEMDCRLP